MTRPLLIGVGNPYRHDDGVGIAVVEELRQRGLPGADVAEESGEPVALVQRWSGRAGVTLIDAMSSGRAAGTVVRFECIRGQWAATPPLASVSTHGLGLATALELGRVLEQLPEELVLVGVEALDVSAGVGLSTPVGAARDEVVAELVHRYGAPAR